MRREIRITGTGGQGVVLAGVILGKALVKAGYHVVQTQSYGAEARGTAAESQVIYSDEPVRFPKVRKCDILIALSQDALNKFSASLKKGGILVVDSDLVQVPEGLPAEVHSIPATREAEKLGLRVLANVIVLAYVAQKLGLVPLDELKKAIEETVPPKTIDLNLRAFEVGKELAKKY